MISERNSETIPGNYVEWMHYSISMVLIIADLGEHFYIIQLNANFHLLVLPMEY